MEVRFPPRHVEPFRIDTLFLGPEEDAADVLEDGEVGRDHGGGDTTDGEGEGDAGHAAGGEASVAGAKGVEAVEGCRDAGGAGEFGGPAEGAAFHS